MFTFGLTKGFGMTPNVCDFILKIAPPRDSHDVLNLPWKACASSIKKSINKIEQIPF